MYMYIVVSAIIVVNKSSFSSTSLTQIDSCCKLSGMPDLSLSFVNSRLLEDPSFHPCVRLKRWEVSLHYCTITVLYKCSKKG